jgi:hypothetical protein
MKIESTAKMPKIVPNLFSDRYCASKASSKKL